MSKRKAILKFNKMKNIEIKLTKVIMLQPLLRKKKKLKTLLSTPFEKTNKEEHLKIIILEDFNSQVGNYTNQEDRSSSEHLRG